MRYVVIGGSIAGISAAEAIRRSDFAAEIIMLSPESGKPYFRPRIASLIERTDADIDLSVNPAEKYRLRYLRMAAQGLDVRSKEVLLSSGNRLVYDKLLIAPGRTPVLPDDIAGLGGKRVFTLRTREDAQRIEIAARGAKHAVVLGGGLVGIQAALALKARGLAVTILEKLDRILSGRLDQRGSMIITDVMRRQDINIVTNQTDYDIQCVAGEPRSVRLASGRIIDADLIIATLGTRPNTEFLRETGIKMNQGIIVQESLQTSAPDVYAAGDVVESRDIVLQTAALCAQWENAQEMGRLAGMSMAGNAVRYDGFLSLQYNARVANVRVAAMGLIDPDDKEYEVVAEGGEEAYRKIVFRNDVMIGALFVGGTEDPGVYAYLIKNRIPLGKVKALAVRGTLGASAAAKKTKGFPEKV